MMVSVVWMIAAVRTPCTLIHVSAMTDTMAKMRWGDKPT
jgi:hypothetical protein